LSEVGSDGGEARRCRGATLPLKDARRLPATLAEKGTSASLLALSCLDTAVVQVNEDRRTALGLANIRSEHILRVCRQSKRIDGVDGEGLRGGVLLCGMQGNTDVAPL